jgi:alpha-glucosidase
LAALLLTTHATPQMYYGEEIGMRTTPPVRKEDVRDPIGKIGWPQEKGRDGERTPMQWDASKNAGFSTAQKPWLPLPPSSSEYNVAEEEQNPNSILNFYKRLIALRRSQAALRDGAYLALNPDDEYVLSYLRRNPVAGDTVLVALNMSGEPRVISVDLAPQGMKQKALKPLLRAPEGALDRISPDRISPDQISPDQVWLTAITIPPFGVFIAAVQ